MRYIKKILFALVALAMMIPLFGGSVSAEGEMWLFIDGENITRGVDMAVIYRGVPSTGQSQWGYDVIIDAANTVTEIIDSGEAAGADLAVPDGGAVVSATGVKTDWLKDNISIGDILYYDSYTQRLFVCDANGDFNPYFSKEFIVEDFQGAYAVTEAEDVKTYTDHVYGIYIDADGTVVARGGNTDIPQDGTAIFATTAASRNDLIMYAPLGAHCDITEGMATITYESSMLDTGLETALSSAKSKADSAKAEFDYIDIDALDALLAEAEALTADDYRTVAEMMHRLESETASICAEDVISELRGAFHTPDETTSTEVRATVLSAKAAGLNSLILRVSNGYGTFIPMPEDSKFQQDAKFGGFDVLQSYIDVCRDEGVALTLCVDVYYNEFASLASPEWLTASNGNDTGLSNKYFSPASVEFQNYFVEYVKHIISNYDIDSIMFDYLRYPKFTETSDLGYDYDSIQGFAKEYEIPITEVDSIKTELFNSPHWATWVEYRMGLVNSMAQAIADTVRGAREDITLLAVAERDTVDYFYMQDSLNWITDKLFDGVCVAMFEADGDELDSLGGNAYYDGLVADKGQTFASYTGKNAYFFTGIESSDAINAEMIGNAVIEARSLNADGFVFSSLEDLVAQNYHRALADGVLRGSAVSPLGDRQDAMKDILQFSKLKIHDHILAMNGCDDETSANALAKIDEALQALNEGVLSYDDAKALESDMAMLFAASNAKSSVLKEFEALTKIALLAKEKSIDTTPPSDEPDEDVSGNETSDVVSDVSDIVSNTDVSEEASIASQAAVSTEEPKVSVDMGSILIYGFVGIAAIAVIAAMIVGIRRKNDIDPNHHMPKGSADGYEDKE